MHTRKAFLPDAVAIHDLILQYSGDGTLLPRSLPEICENVRDFTVVEDDDGSVIGCAALHFYSTELAEVRSVAVDRQAQGRSAGKALIKALIREARQHRIVRVFCLTRAPEFFGRIGFEQVDVQTLPEKVMKDCVGCPRLNCCDEIAMVYAGAEMRDVPRRDHVESGLRVLQ